MADNFRIGEHVLPKDKSYGDFDTLGFNTARGTFIGIIKAVTPPLQTGSNDFIISKIIYT